MPDNPDSSYVIIDDTDPRIEYEGDWSPEVKGANDDWGSFGAPYPQRGSYGPPYNGTLNRITNAGSLSFRFSGTSLDLQASIDTTEGKPSPVWKCLVDGTISGDRDTYSDTRTNHLPVCTFKDLAAGGHTFTFNVTVPSGGAGFWIDRFTYHSNEPVSFGETIYVGDSDLPVSYSPPDNFNLIDVDVAHGTDIPGSSIILNFTGCAASLFTVLADNKPDGKGHYSIDGQPNVSFIIPTNPGSDREYNVELFRTPVLPAAKHTLIVTFDGQQGDMPLRVDNFYITLPPGDTARGGDGIKPPLSQRPTSSSKPSPSQHPTSTSKPSQSQTPQDEPSQSLSPDSKGSVPIGSIVGGGVGGAILLALVVALVVFSRRKRRQIQAEIEMTVPTPFLASSYYRRLPKDRIL